MVYSFYLAMDFGIHNIKLVGQLQKELVTLTQYNCMLKRLSLAIRMV